MAQYIVSARKYRPNTFASVVGQRHVTDTLIHSLQTGQVAHAYLFCGPRGVGKTTVARILAKAINCENLTPEGEACNVCTSCKNFDVNSSFNIFELDGASNNSVENIRSLVEQVRIPPSQGKYKVYIIDEVHMLSLAAFNAFLKTLEEPPSYVKFILATTEKHKILPTILSRCQSFDFRRIPVPEIAEHLKEICVSESISAEDEALIIISQKGDGSLRDSLSIFDRIASQAKGKITYTGVLDNLQLLDYDYFFTLTDAMVREDMTSIFLTLADIQKRGFDGEAVLSGLSEHFRDLLLCKDTATSELLTHGDKIKIRYLKQAEVLPRAALITYLDLINQCEIYYNRALNKWLHIEMAMVRMCYMNRRSELTTSTTEVQKKKPEPTPVILDSIIKNGNGHPIEATPVQEELKPEKNTPVKTTNVVSEIAEQPLPEVNASSLSNAEVGDVAIPSLKGLQSLRERASLKYEEEKKKTPTLNLAMVQEFWKEFSENHSSQSLRHTLNEAVVEIKGEKMIVIRTGNQTGKNRLTAESNLLDGLRSLIRIPDLQIVLEIDPELDKSKELIKPKKLLTSREKFEILSAKNPLMLDLRDKLDLIPDQDE
ncbi:MAG TPA: DNA polymerase III subunit gamma/tau [Saprospiraceae bacterium]|nr:DNA polymerase III subunit gamma/tau [Saprospiraceae bacterium]